MAQFATSFIVVNLGCEMLYVVEQRLTAQNIPQDKANKVLTDITSILLNANLLEEILTPHPMPDHKVVKQLLHDLSGASIMKLDDYSWNKLWDLMTVVFKWQMTVCLTDVFDITRRHLDGVANIVKIPALNDLFKNAKKKFTDLHGRITACDLEKLTVSIKNWLSCYNAKISVLIRLGLQRQDGIFVVVNSLGDYPLDKLGDNIYKSGGRNTKPELNTGDHIESCEVSCLINQLKGSHSSEDATITVRLPIKIGNSENCAERSLRIVKTDFKDINTVIKQKNEELVFNQELPKSAQQDLLEMLDFSSNE